MIYIILLIIAVIIAVGLIKLFKVPKLDCLTLVTGGVKTGKSMLTVYLAVKKFKSQQRKYKIRCFFIKLFNFFIKNKNKKLKELEEPLLYSNVKLAGVHYIPFTEKHLRRLVRFNYGSVILIQEASLLADSQYIKNLDDNERLLLFNKLIGHETKGGFIFYDTQSVQDCHYSIKRCLNSCLYIHHKTIIPFFVILSVRELAYSADDNLGVSNNFDSDIEDTMLKIIVPKKIWNYYDCYTYSSLTDDLPVKNDIKFNKIVKFGKKPNLKTNDIVTLKKFYSIQLEKIKAIEESTKYENT